ncbi:hypothetical protein [Modicisalibacter luteus]|uniref:YfhG lipoprotein n=1 Tax=Modicisalibacter luteus TaxID=453962 RepID=A0ABV7M799_9GAMM|nr:hypothetical protein [Halomonas lutea]GHA99053.1 hypothetical protein GCM10007159_20990 [Halomonas lutea]
MRILPLLASLLAVSLLAGCQALNHTTNAPFNTASSDCLSEVPSLHDNECLLEAWVDFGLAAQRGDEAWRERTLKRAEGELANERLARAVVYSWSDRSHWDDASELFKADLALAPSRLQPLLRQWLNGLEARRELANQVDHSEAARRQVARERDDLAQKLDALTEIEQSINLRNQSP